ncbi:hypothetical protein [Rubritalea tangerina]|uniref:hypothetical protein n=1 Tax=Rubritalea tangerina TaxID=430798 RepID=UPI0036237E8D
MLQPQGSSRSPRFDVVKLGDRSRSAHRHQIARKSVVLTDKSPFYDLTHVRSQGKTRNGRARIARAYFIRPPRPR